MKNLVAHGLANNILIIDISRSYMLQSGNMNWFTGGVIIKISLFPLYDGPLDYDPHVCRQECA